MLAEMIPIKPSRGYPGLARRLYARLLSRREQALVGVATVLPLGRTGPIVSMSGYRCEQRIKI
jgi:hypothetical protein